MSFSIQCPACKTKLKVKSDKIVGKQLPCPKCKHVFVVPAVTADASRPPTKAAADSDELGLSNLGLDNFSPQAAPAAKPAPRAVVAAATPKKAAAKPSKKSAGSGDRKKMLIIGGAAVGGVVVVALLVFLMIKMFSWPSAGTAGGNSGGGAGSNAGGSGTGAAGGQAAGTDEPKVDSAAMVADFRNLFIRMRRAESPNQTEEELGANFDRTSERDMAEARNLSPDFFRISKAREQTLLTGTANPQAAELIKTLQNAMVQLQMPTDAQLSRAIDSELAGQPSPLRQEVLAHILAFMWRRGMTRLALAPQISEADWNLVAEVEQKVFGSGSLLMGAAKAPTADDHALRYANSMKQVGLALHNFHDIYKSFPLADRKTNLPNAAVGLSWRVWILPFVGEEALYNKFHQDEAWDSPHNQTLIAEMPAVYQSLPALPAGKTTLHVFTGATAPFRPSRKPEIASILDGTSNTVMCVLGGPETAMEWTRPGGIEFEAGEGVAQLGASPSTDGFPVLLFDGAVQMMPNEIDPQLLAVLVQPDDGRSVPPGMLIPIRSSSRMSLQELGEKLRSLNPKAAGAPGN
jgi:predicted Zn finger-like uncharacterized protein